MEEYPAYILLYLSITPMKPIITSERLYVRPFTLDDLGNLFALHSNPDVAKTTIDGIQDKETVKEHLRNFIAHQEKYGYSQWAIWDTESNTFAGRGGLTTRILNEDVGLSTEIRFAFMPKFWGRGYASEFAFAVKDYARDILQLPKIVASSSPKNDKSNRILEKVGFKFIKNILPQGYDVSDEITYNELHF